MIQEIKVKNFLSFKKEITFSFEATKDTFAEDYQVVEVAPGVRLLRFAMVYGANASGKSNLLSVIRFLGSFWRNIPQSVDEGTNIIPFLLDFETPNNPSEFEIIFYVENKKYWYQLTIDKQTVVSEKLFVYNSVQPTLLFDRKLENDQSVIHYGAPIKISSVEKEKITVECLKNMSFFAARNKVNISLPDIDDAKQWLIKQIMPIVAPETSLFEYAENHITKDTLLKTHLLNFIKQADFNISDIKTDVIKETIPEQYLNLFLNDENIPAFEKDRLKKEKTIFRKRYRTL
jgi:AAA15 family ATPase/GTPase